MLTKVIVFHGLWCLWHTIPVGIKRYVCPNRSVFISLMSSFFYNSKKETFTTSLLHCLPLFYTYFITTNFLNTSRRCSSTMKTTCLLYILLNTTFLSSEIFGIRLVSVDLLASVRNRQTWNWLRRYSELHSWILILQDQNGHRSRVIIMFTIATAF